VNNRITILPIRRMNCVFSLQMLIHVWSVSIFRSSNLTFAYTWRQMLLLFSRHFYRAYLSCLLRTKLIIISRQGNCSYRRGTRVNSGTLCRRSYRRTISCRRRGRPSLVALACSIIVSRASWGTRSCRV